MSVKIDRRKFLAGTSVGTLAVLTLGGCSGERSAPGKQGSEADLKAGEARPHYVMVFDQNKCIGCGLCKTACNEANKLPKGRSRLLLERQALYVEGQDPGYGNRKYVRVSCQQCQDAPCIRVCPTGAAMRDKDTGIVTMDPDRCVGCKYCIAACPYNVRYINEETKVADNCDFCLKSRLSKGEDPACVTACRHGALFFGDANDPGSYVSRLMNVKDTVRVRPELGTEPNLRYIPIMKQGV